VAANWRELTISQHIMWPFIARNNEQLDPQCGYRRTTASDRGEAFTP